MSGEKKVTSTEDLQKTIEVIKSLGASESLEKGHNSREGASTKVETMRDAGVGAGSGSGGTQVYHTPSNSDPGSWAGSTAQEVGEDGAKDNISEDGTDYAGGAMMKSIMEKLAKGLPLTAEEFEVVKAMPAFMKKNEQKDEKEDDKDKDDVKKSLADEAASSEAVSQGMEISEFLADFVTVFSKSLSGLEDRVIKSVTTAVLSAVGEATEKQEAFNKSLAGAMATVGEGVVATAQRVDQLETTPARGPKSQQALSKGLDNGGEELSKSQVSGILVDLVKSNQIQPMEVLQFESNGVISDSTLNKVKAYRAGK